MWEETGDSDMGSGAGNENGETVVGILEGPASVWGTGIPKDEACLIDSSIAFARSSSSLEILPWRSCDSFSERAIASASCFSSSSMGGHLSSLSSLGDELVGIRGGVGMRGGGRAKGGGRVSYGEG